MVPDAAAVPEVIKAGLDPDTGAGTGPGSGSGARPAATNEDPLPARMLNEFVYCPRLFCYEHVEGVFVDNADTLRGSALHKRVDAGTAAMPPARARQRQAEGQQAAAATGEDEEKSDSPGADVPVTIHSRSVHLPSDRLGVTAKLDLVEVRQAKGELFSETRVCPVDYKAGTPKEDADDEISLWDIDKIQLALQCLILRDNGHACD